MPRGTTPNRGAVLALLCAVDFMVILDSQIVILGIPPIERDLGFSADAVQWVLSAYLLAFGGLLLLGGRLGDLLGHRRVLLAGSALFGLASLLCGLAWSPGVLIAARVLQGLAAAAMAPTALAILMTTFSEDRERHRALAVWGAVGGLGATAALLIGGVVVDALSWRWIFLLNVPVAVVLVVLAPRLLAESRLAGTGRTYDPLGALTVTGAVMLVILAVTEAPDAGWGSASTLALLAGAVVLLVAFVRTESRAAVPLVPLRLFRMRSLVAGNIVMVIAAMMAWSQGLTASLYAQQVLGLSAIAFGVGTTAMTLMTLVGSFLAQRFVAQVGPGVIAAISMVFMGTGLLLLSGMSADGSYWTDLLPGFLVFGPGLGAGTVAASIAALHRVPERHAGVASGMNNASFQLGGALGTAVAVSVAASHTEGQSPQALTDGFQAALVAAAALAVLGLAAAASLIRSATTTPAPAPAA